MFECMRAKQMMVAKAAQVNVGLYLECILFDQ